ncbi:MAG: hypothetical protein HYX61_10970 [Gammaproteobacteria bacterium]|nr:hypothetical protein [Gammaproteobacteria bacterium]
MSKTFQTFNHPPSSAMEWMMKLAVFEDAINQKGLCAFVAKGCNDLPLEDKVTIAALLANLRYEYKEHNLNLVFRNSEYFARSFVNELFESLKFPMDKNNKKGFYELVVKAKTGDVNAAMQLKGIFNNTPKMVIDSLLSFYNAYLTQVEKEGEHLPDKVQLGRIAKAKEIFLSVISFAFVESKALELSAHDGFTPFIKSQLSKDFRKLKECGIMNGLIDKLDKANNSYQPVQIKEELKLYFDDLVETRSKQFIEFNEHHHEMIKSLHDKVSNLHQFCMQASREFHIDSELHKKIKHTGASIENIFFELNTFLIKGNKITNNDIERADKYIQDIINQKINNKTLLQIAVLMGEQEKVEQLIDAGAFALTTTTDYERGFFTKLRDAFIGFPKELIKNWRYPFPRTVIEIAEISGQNDLAVLMNEKMQQRKECKFVFHNEASAILPNELDFLLSDDTINNEDVPVLESKPIESKNINSIGKNYKVRKER